MWAAPDGWLDVLSRSHVVTPQATITLEGDELATVTPSGWSLRRQLQGNRVDAELSMAVPDETSRLLTDDYRSPLQAYGQRVDFRLRVTSGSFEAVCPMGIYRTESAVPAGGHWTLYPNGRWKRPSTLVDVTGVDLLALTVDHDFLEPSVPPVGSTAHSEIRRLLDGDMQTRLTVADQPIESAPWEGTRIAALLDLFAAMDAVAVVGRSGLLESIPSAGSGQRLQISPADPDGYVPSATTGLVDWRPEATREGVYNGVTTEGQTADGESVQGFDFVRSGPLAWRPQGYGRVTYKHDSPLITSSLHANFAAATRLRNLTASRTRTLTIHTLPNPALDVLDTVEVVMPETERIIPALVTAIELGDGQPMTITASVPWEVPIHG